MTLCNNRSEKFGNSINFSMFFWEKRRFVAAAKLWKHPLLDIVFWCAAKSTVRSCKIHAETWNISKHSFHCTIRHMCTYISVETIVLNGILAVDCCSLVPVSNCTGLCHFNEVGLAKWNLIHSFLQMVIDLWHVHIIFRVCAVRNFSFRTKISSFLLFQPFSLCFLFFLRIISSWVACQLIAFGAVSLYVQAAYFWV